MANWLILEYEYGRLGNRLHTHANALAWCIENKINLINFNFLSSSGLFEKKNETPVHIWLIYRSFLNQIFLKTKKDSFMHRLSKSDKYLSLLRRWLKVITIPESEFLSEFDLRDYFSKNQDKKIILVRAWDIRCTCALKLHQKKIREILTPDTSFRTLAENSVVNLKNKFSVLIGVHARRGDYKQYLDGIHFHDWSKYKYWMCQTKKLFEKKSPLKADAMHLHSLIFRCLTKRNSTINNSVVTIYLMPFILSPLLIFFSYENIFAILFILTLSISSYTVLYLYLLKKLTK